MSRAFRLRLATAGLAALGLLLLLAVPDLPAFGERESAASDLVLRVATAELHTPSAVAAVLYGYRAFDTFGELMILFAGVIGVVLLLRPSPGGEIDEVEERSHERGRGRRAAPPSEAVHWLGRAMVPILALIGLALVAHGPLSPGGGSQGGVLLASGSLLLYMVAGFDAYRRIFPRHIVEIVDGIAALAFSVIGLLGVAFGGAFLQGFLPLGDPESLTGSGTIALLNAGVGVHVAAAFVLLCIELLDQTHRIRRRRDE